ncbi:MAG: M48 family peptidase [Acidobacteriaceae bacterium]|nr:M48 family peptidase [Acidobacteriaceae bacterium]
MQIETALFFESIEQIYERVFRTLKPRTAIPRIVIQFRKYANANSRIELNEGVLSVFISDLLEGAPAPIQEAIAAILIAKLYGKVPDRGLLARYRRYLNRAEVRRTAHLVKQQRGRKAFRDPRGAVFDLCTIFEELNSRYFHGLMGRPELGWSVRPSRTKLGEWDPSHNVIVLSSLLDSPGVPELVVRFIMFHEMLHLRHPTEHRRERRCVHTRAFKDAEKEFEGYDEARLALEQLLERAA